MDIGIFGGSFNPIHIGHLIVAEEVFQQRNLSKILFMPTGISPHKKSSGLIAAVHRYEMVKLAICDNEHFDVSDIEIKRSGKSYTIDTIKTLSEELGKEHNLFLILGTDMINEIDTWKDIAVLSQMCHFIVVNRFPIAMNNDIVKKSAICSERKEEIEKLMVQIPSIGISSTEIREKLNKGLSIKYLVPTCVEDYIRTQSLYLKR
ncbi:MAG: nicotinate-nucleotide adenylyltransferase [Candidatus Kuenenia sp.]|nr:nicotinate-nucleotide adenylyltransferase [Candidatus Kuenenia hertensis]